MDLRLATCRPLPEPDPDEEPLRAALAAHGVRARAAAWNDPDEDWDAPVPTVLRSTWDYPRAPQRFRAWIERAARAAPLWNPPEVLHANLHKSYLGELAADGVAVLPTAFLARGAGTRLAEVLAERGWDDVVVKPAVSAGSFRTLRVRHGELARGEAHLAALLAERDALVQRYAAAVETSGERALVWIGGLWTHAVRKSPRFSGEGERVSGALPIAEDERRLGEAALERWREELLYARVDLVRDESGTPRLMELELVEPSLFLVQHPPALARFAAALARRVREARR
jgi:glutathione synthase/RimK-type ligase-like ATP-grasp enzyme